MRSRIRISSRRGSVLGSLISSIVVAMFAALITFSSFSPSIAYAAASDYAALVTSISAPRQLSPGERAQVTVVFSNIGIATWEKSGEHFTSLYRWDPVRKIEIPSVFHADKWETPERAVRLFGADVRPKESVTITFLIQAPNAPGTYHEEFILTAEDAAWIKHGTFALDIRVQTAGENTSSQPSSPASNTVSVGPWAGALVDTLSTDWQMKPEDHTILNLAFKNTGTETWYRDSARYLSLYATDGTRERPSTFRDPSWMSASHVGKMKETVVKPGEIAHIALELRTPRAPGLYQESFTLAAEDTAWIRGTTFTLPIRVLLTSEIVAQSPSGQPLDVPVPTAVSALQAQPLLQSAKDLTLSGNGRAEFMIGYKNIGTDAWPSRSLRVKGVVPALTGTLSSVRDDSWTNPNEPVYVRGETKPGELGFLTFKIKAPAKKGAYIASFQLYVEDDPVDGGEIDIPITVTADGDLSSNAPSTNQSSESPPTSSNPTVLPLGADATSLPDEPMIRVGVLKTEDDRMVVKASYVPVNVTQNGTMICRLNTGESSTVQFDRTNKVYKLFGGPCTGQSTSHYLFQAEDGISAMEMADFSRPVSWLPGANDNTFRAQLELRYTPSTDSVWVINELPIEYYLKGMAETSDVSPLEFQKALLTAARTYAMYHVQRGTKHANEFYTVDAKYDQVYRGYGAEARSPNIVAGIDATRGQIVTYQEKLAITPYFSRSDGRTRAWGEVWGGGSNYPWLVSVPVPWDEGKTLWGHGVGMSASGALGMARDGVLYDKILAHFYRGTDIRKMYK